jgi:hypothetical protein
LPDAPRAGFRGNHSEATMKIDKFDIIWFLGWSAFLVTLGMDATALWFWVFGWLMTMWFGEPILDWWADRIVARERAKVWKGADRGATPSKSPRSSACRRRSAKRPGSGASSPK